MRRLALKKLAVLGALLTGAALTATNAMAQEWPKKQPIKLVVGAAAGGGTDVLARITAEFLQRRIGQAVVVENKPGAGTAIAVDFVAKSAPDGYTFMLIYNDLVILPAVRNNLPYKFDDLTYLIRPFAVPPVVFVGPDEGPDAAGIHHADEGQSGQDTLRQCRRRRPDAPDARAV